MGYKLLNSKDIWRGRSLALVEEEALLPNGKRVIRETFHHPGAVVVLPQTSAGKLVMINQFRRALRKEILEFPAGTLEPDEDPFECAKREIIEEIGMGASNWKQLGMLYPAPGFCTEIQHCYFASGLSAASAEQDEDEIIEVVELTVAEIEASIQRGEIVDGKSIAIFTKAKLARLI